MKPRSASRCERISVPRSMTLRDVFQPLRELDIVHRGIDGRKGAQHALAGAGPFRTRVYRLGSKVSVCAMPPAIHSRIMVSALASILGAPHNWRGAPPSSADMVALADACMKCRLFIAWSYRTY